MSALSTSYLRAFPSPPLDPSTLARSLSSAASLTASHRKRRPKAYRGLQQSIPLMLFLLLGLFVSQSTAVLISSWDNCLTQSTQMLPNYTQLHPILVSASFDPRRQNTLRITIWGVVTGASSGDPAAGAKQRRYLDNGEELYNSKTINGVGLVNTTTQANATYFGKVFQTAFRFPSPSVNYSYTGEIIDQDKSWENVATTLNVEVDVSSFRVFTNATFFCTTNSDGVVHDNSAGAVCPFGNLVPYIGASMDEKTTDEKMMMRIPPVAVWDNVTYLTKDLRSFSWERRMPSRFQFSTMAVNLKIRAGNSGGTVVGCVNVEVTPEISKVLSSALTWVSAGILIFVGIATALAAMFNPWNGSTDLFRFSSNFGMDEDMLRMVTPGFADCLQWLQFIVLTGSLSVAYPGFYQPIVSHGAWSVLLVNTSLQSRDPIAAEAWKGDGIYALQQWTSGYQRLAQAVGLLTDNDIWVSVMVYFWSVTIGSVVVFQSWFWLRRAIWSITGVEEEDLTSRNWPFTIGLLLRCMFNYFLMPLVTVCTFQLTVTQFTRPYITACSVVLLVVILGISALMSGFICNHRPRSDMYDVLQYLLAYGTLYNTYREKSILFFMTHLYSNILRGIAFGALQPSGIAQITILAVIEIVLILSTYAAKPYPAPTSMNLWHIILSFIRLLTILLMMAFVPSINASPAVRGWTGWVILGIHALVLFIAFLLKGMQTILELSVRGYSHDEAAARGGFAKVFGVRQLSRRKRHSKQTHRSISLSPTPIIGASVSPPERTIASASNNTGPHSRTNSSAILLGSPATPNAPPAPESAHAHSASGSTIGPTSPGPNTYAYFPPPETATAGPYYRPPRTRRVEEQSLARANWTNELWGPSRNRSSTVGSALAGDDDTSIQPGSTDYAVREVDFYYGVRGPALSTQPQRRLGTGPADPTGPVSIAKSWVKTKLGLARGVEEKGFSVVRSARAPEMMLRQQREAAEAAAQDEEEGMIGMAVTSDDVGARDDDDDDEAGPSTGMLEVKPILPRKSSKRKSKEGSASGGGYTSMPFLSVDDEDDLGQSGSATSSLVHPPPHAGRDDDRPDSVGEVNSGRVGAVMRDERGDVRGSTAELVRGGSESSRGA